MACTSVTNRPCMGTIVHSKPGWCWSAGGPWDKTTEYSNQNMNPLELANQHCWEQLWTSQESAQGNSRHHQEELCICQNQLLHGVARDPKWSLHQSTSKVATGGTSTTWLEHWGYLFNSLINVCDIYISPCKLSCGFPRSFNPVMQERFVVHFNSVFICSGVNHPLRTSWVSSLRSSIIFVTLWMKTSCK